VGRADRHDADGQEQHGCPRPSPSGRGGAGRATRPARCSHVGCPPRRRWLPTRRVQEDEDDDRPAAVAVPARQPVSPDAALEPRGAGHQPDQDHDAVAGEHPGDVRHQDRQLQPLLRTQRVPQRPQGHGGRRQTRWRSGRRPGASARSAGAARPPAACSRSAGFGWRSSLGWPVMAVAAEERQHSAEVEVQVQEAAGQAGRHRGGSRSRPRTRPVRRLAGPAVGPGRALRPGRRRRPAAAGRRWTATRAR
jgi:hypothetical protein